MNNKETFVEKLNACGEVKYEMTEIHSRIMSGLKNIYSFVFKREKRDFLSLKNMMYFKGGVASPDARPRLHENLDTFINLVNHYEFLGDDEIKSYLKAHGIEITVTIPQFEDDPVSITKEDTKNFERTWKFSMQNIQTPGTKKEILNAILDRAIEIQKTIEDKKDEINKGAEDVDAECQITKPYFMKALGIKVKELKKRSVDNEIKRIEDDVEASQEIISFFDSSKEENQVKETTEPPEKDEE